MNQKELNEIRRRIKPERSSINHIYGCYVNSQREVIADIDESVGLLSREEVEKYLSLVKKTLSGTLGRNLVDISFATKQVMDSDEHRLLSALRKTELQDAVLGSFVKGEASLSGLEPMRQREVAQVTGISRSYVSRIEKKALEKLRQGLKERDSQ